MMIKALSVRNDFEIAHVERVDIVSILEFKLVQRFPKFRLIIRQDAEMETNAFADPANDRIVVRRSIYRAACENNPEARLILAHELGHYLLHREKSVTMHMDPSGSIQPIKKMNATESTEDQADMFARHFLAPPHIAFRFRHDADALALATSVPLRISRGNVTMSKRPDVSAIRWIISTGAESFL
jgi:Zn-dependent peptidase ImmA (M78 family)